MTADSVEGRLLCTCNVAYDIQGQGSIEARPGYVSGAGFIEPPIACVGGEESMDAALVCRSVDGLVLSFRGTLPGPTPTSPLRIILDWVRDFDASLVPFDGAGGEVHQGFLASLDSIWSKVDALVSAALKLTPSSRLLVTGHSKGGAMAHLAAARLAMAGTVAPTELSVHSFGTPRLGNAAFISSYRALVPLAFRFECQDEIAPYLPPSEATWRQLASVAHISGAEHRRDYELAGQLRFVDWENKLTGDSIRLQEERARRLGAQLRELHFHKIIADHNIEFSSSYMKAVWPSRVP